MTEFSKIYELFLQIFSGEQAIGNRSSEFEIVIYLLFIGLFISLIEPSFNLYRILKQGQNASLNSPIFILAFVVPFFFSLAVGLVLVGLNLSLAFNKFSMLSLFSTLENGIYIEITIIIITFIILSYLSKKFQQPNKNSSRLTTTLKFAAMAVDFLLLVSVMAITILAFFKGGISKLTSLETIVSLYIGSIYSLVAKCAILAFTLSWGLLYKERASTLGKNPLQRQIIFARKRNIKVISLSVITFLVLALIILPIYTETKIQPIEDLKTSANISKYSGKYISISKPQLVLLQQSVGMPQNSRTQEITNYSLWLFTINDAKIYVRGKPNISEDNLLNEKKLLVGKLYTTKNVGNATKSFTLDAVDEKSYPKQTEALIIVTLFLLGVFVILSIAIIKMSVRQSKELQNLYERYPNLDECMNNIDDSKTFGWSFCYAHPITISNEYLVYEKNNKIDYIVKLNEIKSFIKNDTVITITDINKNTKTIKFPNEQILKFAEENFKTSKF